MEQSRPSEVDRRSTDQEIPCPLWNLMMKHFEPCSQDPVMGQMNRSCKSLAMEPLIRHMNPDLALLTYFIMISFYDPPIYESVSQLVSSLQAFIFDACYMFRPSHLT